MGKPVEIADALVVSVYRCLINIQPTYTNSKHRQE